MRILILALLTLALAGCGGATNERGPDGSGTIEPHKMERDHARS